MPDRNTTEARVVSPTGTQRIDAISTPISTTPAPSTARAGLSCTARVKRAIKRARSAGRGTATVHCTNATKATAAKTTEGARLLHANGTTSSTCRKALTAEVAAERSGEDEATGQQRHRQGGVGPQPVVRVPCPEPVPRSPNRLEVTGTRHVGRQWVEGGHRHDHIVAWAVPGRIRPQDDPVGDRLILPAPSAAQPRIRPTAARPKARPGDLAAISPCRHVW